ncbi:MAG: glycosyltransferase [Candidatus Woesearchaeota archaeon]
MRKLLLVGHLFSHGGYGAHSRDITLALLNSKKFLLSAVAAQGTGPRLSQLSPKLYTTLINICNRPYDKDGVCIQINVPSAFKKLCRINIGITAGIEADKLPAGWRERCNQLDALILVSKFEKTLFQRCGVYIPIYVVGEGVDTNIFNCRVKCKPDLKFSNEFNLLAAGEWLENDRKNFARLVELFAKHFSGTGIGLVLKTHGKGFSEIDRQVISLKIKNIIGKRNCTVHLIYKEYSDDEMAQLYRHPQIKGFVTITSGEAWGRMTAEAIACNLPVLATNWGGHLEYMDKKYSILFNCRLVRISPPKIWPWTDIYDPSMRWAEVDERDFVLKIKKFVSNYNYYKQKADEYGTIFRRKWNKKNTDRLLLRTIERILENCKA